MTPDVTRCVVTTDSEEIAEVARDYGGEAPVSATGTPGRRRHAHGSRRSARPGVGRGRRGTCVRCGAPPRPDEPVPRARPARRCRATPCCRRVARRCHQRVRAHLQPGLGRRPPRRGVAPGRPTDSVHRRRHGDHADARTRRGSCASTATSTCGGPTSSADSRCRGSTRARTRDSRSPRCRPSRSTTSTSSG